jgi:DNA invertase Pin-like site-specific DNA recombinase
VVTAAYVRLSRFLPDQTSTQRQATDCRKLAEVRGWGDVEVFEDLDVSAFVEGVRRPAYERMLGEIQAGRVEHVVVWKIDRISRRLVGFMRFQAICDQRGVSVASVSDPYDTSTPIGRAIVAILAVFAELESATIGLRVTSAKNLAAASGRHSGGGYRAFGYTSDRAAVVPEEAEAIQDAARRVLAGEAHATIAREWNAQGLRTPKAGNPWRTRDLTRLLCAPHLAGLRVHRDEVVGEASWPAILDRATHEALKLRRASRSRPAPRRSYLLSGLLVCGQEGCGAPLRPYRQHGKRNYRCVGQPQGTGCGRLSVVAEPVEDYVRTAVLGALMNPAVRRALHNPGNGDGKRERALLATLAAAEGRMADLGEDYAAGRVPRPAFLAATATLQREVTDLERQVARAAEESRVLLLPDSGDMEAEWERRDLTWRNALVAAVFETPIPVQPARRGANTVEVTRRLRLVPRL